MATGNHLLRQIGFNIDISLQRLLDITQRLYRNMGELKRGLKVFTQGLLRHLVNWHTFGNDEGHFAS